MAPHMGLSGESMVNSAQQGIWLMFYAWLLLVLKQVVTTLFDFISRLFVSTVEVSEKDSPEVYRWFQEWISEQDFAATFQKVQALISSQSSGTVEKIKNKGKKIVMKVSGDKIEKTKVNIIYVPGLGSHFFWYQRRLISCHITKERDESAMMSSANPGVSSKLLSLKCFSWTGKGSVVLKNLLSEARDESYKSENSQVGVFMGDPRSGWRRMMSVPAVPFSSVILPNELASSVLEDCKKFLVSENWYIEMGVPYRRGYLFYGPPGSGKSSFVHAIASQLNLDIFVVSLANSSMTDQQFQVLLSSAPRSGLLLLEDIDVLFPDRDAPVDPNSAPTWARGVTMSGFLNSLDGVSGQQGKMVFMTTNYKDRLDEALIRSGRVDLKVQFDYATRDQILRMVGKFFPGEKGLAEALSDLAFKDLEGKVAMSDLQGFLMKHKDDITQLIPDFVDHFTSANKFRKWVDETQKKTEQKTEQKKERGRDRDKETEKDKEKS